MASARRVRLKVSPTFPPSKGKEIYTYTKQVANNTAQIVRVNSSGPFPVHPVTKEKGVFHLFGRIRSWIDEQANFPSPQ